MRINNNISAMNTYSRLTSAQGAQAKSLEKLSSGLRINRAGDDAAGLAISEKMRGQIGGLNQAVRNAQDGISLIQTAEGALSETHSILNRMRELAVQSSNDTNTTDDRAEIQKEIEQLTSEITRISSDTEFNTKKLLNGDMGKTFTVSANNFDSSLQNMQVVGSDIKTGTYTVTATAAGTDTVELGVNTAAASFASTNVTVADGTKFGDYSLQVSNFNGTTADLKLTGPDGKATELSGQAVAGGAIAMGGLTFDFSTNNISSNGTLEIKLSNAGLELDLSGDKTVNSAAITKYKGESINLGGIQFEARWGAATTNDAMTIKVDDKAVKFQIGANKDQNTDVSINNMSANGLGVNALDVTTQDGANVAIETIDNAIKTVSSERSKLGAVQNRLDHTINNLTATSENLSAAESRIRDVDMAKEMMEFTKNNILNQASTAMLAQANQMPQGVLQLLG